MDSFLNQVKSDHPGQAADQDSNLFDEFCKSAQHSLIQSPAEGLAQLGNKTFGTTWKPALIDEPTAHAFGTKEWHAQQLGSAAGMMPWFVAAHWGARAGTRLLASPASAETVTILGRELNKRSLVLAESVAAGMFVGGLLEPTNGSSGNFFQERVNNSLANGATFFAMGKVGQFLEPAAAPVIQNAATKTFAEASRSYLAERGRAAAIGAFSGIVTGPIDSLVKTTVNEHRLPELRELAQSSYTFGFTGAGLGLLGPGRQKNSEAKSEAPKPTVGATFDLAQLEMQRAEIKRGAVSLIDELVSLYPQKTEGKLNYYIGGSLSMIALAHAAEFRLVEPGHLPETKLASGESTKLSPSSVLALDGFIRQIGDLDYVPLDHYKAAEHRLAKGGGGPKLAELTAEAQSALKRSSSSSLMCDPVQAVNGDHRIAVVQLNGREIYINAPADALAYKVIHIMEKLGNVEASPKYAGDFKALLTALDGIYPQDQLVSRTNEVLAGYNKSLVNGLYVPEYTPEYSGRLKTFVEELIACNPDAPYLKDLQYGKERAIGVLRILNRLPDHQSKQSVIEFINANRLSIDNWDLVDSESNRKLAADWISKNQEFLNRYSNVLEDKSPAAIALKLITHPYMMREAAKLMPKETTFQKRPVSAEVLDVLMRVDPSNAKSEMAAIERLTQAGTSPFALARIMDSQWMNEPTRRQNLFSLLERAQRSLDSKTHTRFVAEVKEALVADIYLQDNHWVVIQESDRPARLASVVAKFGLSDH